MTINDYVPEEFVPLFSNESFQDALNGYIRYLVKEDQDFRTEIKSLIKEEITNSFDPHLAMSELRPIQRLAALETLTGIDAEEDEDREPNLPDRIQDLEYKIANFEYSPTINPVVAKTPETKTELRASFLVEALQTSEKDYFSARDIMDFLSCKLPESCKIDEKVRNIRKVKQDVVRKAEEMFSSLVEINKKTCGHRDVRLILKS